MRKLVTAGLTAAALALSATPATAATVFGCGGGSNCVSGTTNVNLVNANDVTTGFGNVGIGGPLVTFTTTNPSGMDLDASGQATITSGATGTVLENLAFAVTGGFTTAEFSLSPLTGGGPPQFFTVAIGLDGGATQLFTTADQRFAIQAGAGERITSVQITTPTGGIGAFTQLRVGTAAIAAVPEPGTWALMLLGFGAVGSQMRRQRRRSQIMQLA